MLGSTWVASVVVEAVEEDEDEGGEEDVSMDWNPLKVAEGNPLWLPDPFSINELEGRLDQEA